MSSSSIAPDLGDAVQPDGTLKDTSEIIWSYDADESLPFPPSDSVSGVQTAILAQCAPAMMVAGARRTTRLHRPSQRALEAAETTPSGSASTKPGAKRKAPSNSIPNHCITHKVVVDVNDDDGATTEPAEDDYESIKAMADTDNQVCPLLSLFVQCSH